MSTQAVAKSEQTAEATGMVAMIERMALSPDVDVGKLEKLLDMRERIMARQAAQEYAEAMTTAQEKMSAVSQDASNPQTNSKYASYQALDKAIRPIYTAHGFGVSFDTADCPLEKHVRVVCDVMHRGGHIEHRHIDIPADGKGAKGGDVMTLTHATMSAVSYGRSALLKMIFNIAEGKDTDDDGNAASADAFLSEEQVAELRQLIMDVDADLPKLLIYLKVERLEDIFANKFDVVKRVIEQKRKKAQKQEPARGKTTTDSTI